MGTGFEAGSVRVDQNCHNPKPDGGRLCRLSTYPRRAVHGCSEHDTIPFDAMPALAKGASSSAVTFMLRLDFFTFFSPELALVARDVLSRWRAQAKAIQSKSKTSRWEPLPSFPPF